MNFASYCRRIGSHGVVLVVLGTLWGCNRDTTSPASNADPELLAATRAELVLQEEPEGAVGVLELREKLAAAKAVALTKVDASGASEDSTATDEDAAETIEDGPDAPSEISSAGAEEKVTVIGRIPAPGDNLGAGGSPWEPGQAKFILVDAAAGDAHEHAHPEGHDCPYCNANSGQMMATVQFLGDDNQPVPLDARELFQLQGGELVVVQGTARLVVGVLMVDADGIFVRQ